MGEGCEGGEMPVKTSPAIEGKKPWRYMYDTFHWYVYFRKCYDILFTWNELIIPPEKASDLHG